MANVMECSPCWVESQTLPSWKLPPTRELCPPQAETKAHRAGGQGPKGAPHTQTHTYMLTSELRWTEPCIRLWAADDREGRAGSSVPFLVKPGLQVQHLAQPEPPRLDMHCGDGPRCFGEVWSLAPAPPLGAET